MALLNNWRLFAKKRTQSVARDFRMFLQLMIFRCVVKMILTNLQITIPANFNRQVRNNIEKFEGEDFMFQLTAEGMNNLRYKIFTSCFHRARNLHAHDCIKG